MASVKLMETKDGRRFYKISVRRHKQEKDDKEYKYTRRWYIPEGMTSKRAIESALKKAVIEFERDIEEGKALSRQEKAEIEEAAAAEKAKLKTFRDYSEGVFMNIKASTISENTRANYQMFLDHHIYPVLGDFLLTEITPAMITKLISDYRKKGYSHSSAIKLYNVLNGVFDMAFMDDSIPISPMLKVKRPAHAKGEKVIDEAEKSLSAERLAYVLECVDKEPLMWRTFMHLAADTGARKGELCGLQWRDIKWKDSLIVIRRNLQYTPDGRRDGLDFVTDTIYITTPKNGKGRTVDIGEDTLSLLKELKDSQDVIDIKGWVFNQRGSTDPINPQSPTRYFKKFGDKYGIDGFHPHQLRHTAASIAVTTGADMKSTADRLGHSEAVMLRKYVHSTEESRRESGQKVRDKVKKAKEA